MKKRIVVITDCIDVAFNEIRATILNNIKSDKKNNIEVEPLVTVKEFSIINASFLARLLADSYDPKSTIFLIIVNTLKTNTKERARIIGETLNGFKFVTANTGVVNWLIKDFGLKKLYEFSKTNLTGKNFISFGGKFFHAPMAARVALDIPFKMLGEKRSRNFLRNFEIEEGTVVHIDSFGVLKIKGKLPQLQERTKLEVKVNGKKKCRAIFTNSMKDLTDGKLAVYPGSSLNNLPEMGMVRCLGTADKLEIKIGDKVEFKVLKNGHR